MSRDLHSSGDLLVDRLYGYGKASLAEGDREAAIDLFTQVSERAPHWAAGWMALGEALLGEDDGKARTAFEQVAALDQDDLLGSRLQLARLEQRSIAMSDRYVAALFDDYAPRFDAALREGLDYRGPELLLAALEKAFGPTRHYASLLDLGCGTGLVGEVFADCTSYRTGVDLSEGMVERAHRKGIYERLEVAGISPFLEADRSSYDLIVAADVFVYVCDIAPVIAACAHHLKSGGVLAFTVQTHAGDAVLMGEDLRYAHGRPLVEEAVNNAGLRLVSLEPASTRKEKGKPVAGLVVLASRG